MKTVHVIGNSHVSYFIGREMPSNEEVVFDVGDLTVKAFKAGTTGVTIFGLRNTNSMTGAREKFVQFLQDKDVQDVVIVLGDVDFREHLIKHMSGWDPTDTINGIIDVYREYIKQRILPLVKGKIILFEMVPFSEEFYRGKIKENLRNGSLWFFWEQFNAHIRAMAEKEGWMTISVSNELMSPHGFLSKEHQQKNDLDPHASYVSAYRVLIPKLKTLLETK